MCHRALEQELAASSARLQVPLLLLLLYNGPRRESLCRVCLSHLKESVVESSPQSSRTDGVLWGDMWLGLGLGVGAHWKCRRLSYAVSRLRSCLSRFTGGVRPWLMVGVMVSGTL